MTISLTEDFKTVQELATQTKEILEQVRKNARPVVITQADKPTAVLLGVAQYEWMVHLLNLSHMLNKGMDDVLAGRTKPAEQVFKEVGLGKKKASR